MAVWSEFEGAEPHLAQLIAARFSSHPHHVLGTLRADGSPRLSGVNVFINDGHMWFGSMPGAQKVSDILRDPRIALHSAPLSEDLVDGDASVSGVARRLTDDLALSWKPESPPDGDYFEIDIVRAHLVTVVGEDLVISVWDNAKGLRIVKR